MISLVVWTSFSYMFLNFVPFPFPLSYLRIVLGTYQVFQMVTTAMLLLFDPQARISTYQSYVSLCQYNTFVIVKENILRKFRGKPAFRQGRKVDIGQNHSVRKTMSKGVKKY